MASVNFYGPTSGKIWNGSQYVYCDSVWHYGSDTTTLEKMRPPILRGGGTLTANRNGSTISGSISGCWCDVANSNSYYNYAIYIQIRANGEVIKTIEGCGLNVNAHFADVSTTFEYTSNSAVEFTVAYHCGMPGGCTDINKKPMAGSVNISAYNPWTNPTNLSNVTVSPLSIKPEGSITISWNAATSGTGNTIDKYEIAISSNRFGWKYQEVGNVTSKTIAPRSLLTNDNQIRPGDIISVAVRVHYTSQTPGYNDGWLDWVYASSSYNVSVYKDGIIYYQPQTGNIIDCTMAYVQQDTNVRKAVRYVLVQSTETGSYKIIDEYTTHYE